MSVDVWDAEMRRLAAAGGDVRLGDGRTGRLRFWPSAGSRAGLRARVVLPSGAWLSVDADQIRPQEAT